MARTRAATDRLSARILRRVRAEMVAAVERELGSLDAIYAQVAADVQSDIRGVTSRSEIEAIARVRMNAALAEALPIIQSGVTAAAVAGANTPAETFAAVFPDTAAPRFGAQREAQRAAADVLRGRIRARDVPIARRMNQNHQAFISELGREVEQSLQAGETSWNTMERILDVRQREGVVADMPRYIERLREAAEIGGEKLQKELRAAEAYARRLGSLDRANTSMRAGTEELIKRLRRANAEDIDAAVARWLEDKAQYQAKVIARHERNEAHRTAYQRSMRDKPWVKGFKWSLSPSHPRADVCFPAGTLVTTQRGQVPIEDVRVGDLALTHMGRVRRVACLSRTTGDQELVSLRCQADSSRDLLAEATRNHPFATDRGWVAAGDLRVGDRILVLREGAGCPRPCDTACTGQSGSPRSGTSEHRGTLSEEQCAERRSCPRRMCTSACATSTTGRSLPGNGSDHSPSSRLTSSDSQHPCASRKACDGALLAGTKCRGDASRGSGCPCRDSLPPCTSSSSNAASSLSAGTPRDTNRTPAACDSTTPDSSRCCRTCSRPAPSDASLAHCSACMEQAHRIEAQLHTPGCTCVAGSLSCPPQSPFPSVASASCSIHMSSCSWFEYATLNAIGHATTASEVFNIEVEEDHSYVANGLVVHNCDLLANQNLHGLGPGGYPPDGVPATPHPGCTCTQTAIIDQMNTERELAELEGTPPPPETWKVGGFASASDWLGRQPEELQLAILGPTRLEAFRDDPARVLDEGGAIRRVQDIRPPARRR